MVFAPYTFVLKLLFWPNKSLSQLIFLKNSTHFIGCFSILFVAAKLVFFFAPENTLRPIMIFIARTTGVTETSGTRISPFFSLGTFLLFPSIKGLQNSPSSLTSLVRSSFRSLANVLRCCNQMIDCAFYTVGTAIPLNAVNDNWQPCIYRAKPNRP